MVTEEGNRKYFVVAVWEAGSSLRCPKDRCTLGGVVLTGVLTRQMEVSLPPYPCRHDDDDDDKINNVRTETTTTKNIM